MFRHICCLLSTVKRLAVATVHSRLVCLGVSLLLGTSLLSLVLLFLHGPAVNIRAAASADPWTVFTPVEVTSPNQLSLAKIRGNLSNRQ